MSDAIDTVGRKVAAIFAELVGDRAERLNGSVIAEPAMSTIESALTEQYGVKAHDVAFHMADWNSDAAFVVAVHLFPERFTREEIAAGVGLFLVHAPNHIRAASASQNNTCGKTFPSTMMDTEPNQTLHRNAAAHSVFGVQRLTCRPRQVSFGSSSKGRREYRNSLCGNTRQSP